jgi:hypothetical protein
MTNTNSSTPFTPSQRKPKRFRQRSPKQNLRAFRQSRRDKEAARPARPSPPDWVVKALQEPKFSTGLAPLAEKRVLLTATALQYGSRTCMKNGRGNRPMETLVLTLGTVTLVDTGEVLAHRIMMNVAEGMASAKLAPGDTFQFVARVVADSDTNCQPHRYRLIYPSKIIPVLRVPRPARSVE